MHCVYVIQAGNGPVKVGIAANAAKRMRELSTGCPFQLSIAHEHACEIDVARRIETTAHRILRAQRVGGEWFECSGAAAIAAIDKAASAVRDGIDLFPPRPKPPTEPKPRDAMPITPEQCRAARGLLDWTQKRLADAAEVGIVTVRQYEGGKTARPQRSVIAAMERAFVSAGVEFLPGGAVLRDLAA